MFRSAKSVVVSYNIHLLVRRTLAPGTIAGSDFDGEENMHLTAVMYALRSLEPMWFLAHVLVSLSMLQLAWESLPVPSHTSILECTAPLVKRSVCLRLPQVFHGLVL
jgi:hypothetical protein